MPLEGEAAGAMNAAGLHSWGTLNFLPPPGGLIPHGPPIPGVLTHASVNGHRAEPLAIYSPFVLASMTTRGAGQRESGP